MAELLARKRVGSEKPKETAQGRSKAHLKPRVDSAAADRAALLHLALFAVLSVAVYYLTLVHPYSLQRMWMMRQLDMDRLAPSDPAVHWFLLGGLITEGILYYLAWQALQRVQRRGPAWVIVIGGALAASVVLLFFYPLGSTDIWDYIAHGRMLALYNANPFVRVAAQYPQDLFSWYAGWRYDPSAYGPFWEVLAAITARVAGNGVVANVVAFKALSGIFLAASVATVGVVLRRQAPDKLLTGVFLLAWNPLVLYETLGNGHNDIVMVFWLLVAVRMLLDRHYTLAILALVAGALVKFIPLLMVPAAGMIALRELRTLRARALFVGVTAVASLALIVAAYQPFWAGPQILGVGRRQEMFTSSLPAAIVAMSFPQSGWLDATREVSKAAGVLTALFALAEGLRAWSDRSWQSFTRSAFNISMFYLLVTCLWFWPWYAIWALALAPLLPSGYAFRLAQVFGVAALSKPLIFGPLFGWKQPPEHDWVWQQMRIGPSVMALPWIYALYGLFMTMFSHIQDRWQRAQAQAVPRGAPAYAMVASGEQQPYRRHEEPDD